MDWRSVNFDWNRARAFLVTAEEGSVSGAARALGLSQPTVSRQIDALESELSLVLFERVGRGFILTPAGHELLQHVRGMGEAATRMSLSASAQSHSLDGCVRITAIDVYSAFLLPPIIARLRLLHPGLKVELVASDAVADLRRREADIAIRNAASTDPDVIVRKLRDDRAHIYATESYLRSVGDPGSLEDIAAADFLGYADNRLLINALHGLGIAVTERNFPVICDNQLVQWELVKRGLGIGVMMESVGDAEPMVRRVIPSLAPITVPTWLATHRELNSSARIRTVFDFLASELTPRKT